MDASSSHPPASILVCSAAWKESLPAATINAIVTKTLQKHHPEWQFTLLPFSDGGDGWLDTIAVLYGSAVQIEQSWVTGPLPHQKVLASYGWMEDKGTLLIEAAEIHGIRRLPSGKRSVMTATSHGIGELLQLAQQRHPQARQIILSVGGSASVDGGLGLLQALGWRFQNQHQQDILSPIGGKDLAAIHHILPPQYPLIYLPVMVLVDVQTPYLEAPRIFGPQKGASSDQVLTLNQGFQRVLTLLDPDHRLVNLAGTGAAGGVPFSALIGIPDTTLKSGSDWLLDTPDYQAALSQADLIITGEGCFDETSHLGKGTGCLIQYACSYHKPLIVFCGQSRGSGTFPRNIQVIPLMTETASVTQDMFAQTAAQLKQTVLATLSTIEQRLALPKV